MSQAFRHILLFKLAAHVDDADEQELLEALRRLPSQFPQIRDFVLGCNMSRRDDAFTFGMTMTFADEAAMESYLASPAHEKFVTDHFKPMIERRAIVCFEIDDVDVQ